MTLPLLSRPRTAEDLQQIVQEELRWDAHLTNTPAIGVSVKAGVVTLWGEVPTFAEKMAAQEAAHRVTGVQDVVNDITVSYPGHPRRTDTEIAQAVRRALEWDAFVPEQHIRTTVEHGWVTLDGTVPRWLDRHDAERVVRNLAGVRNVENRLAVVPPPRPTPDPELVRKSIEAALDRQMRRDVQRLGVTVRQGDGHPDGRGGLVAGEGGGRARGRVRPRRPYRGEPPYR